MLRVCLHSDCRCINTALGLYSMLISSMPHAQCNGFILVIMVLTLHHTLRKASRPTAHASFALLDLEVFGHGAT